MIKQNVIINNLDSLYEILEEIKEILSFNISKYDSENDITIKKKVDLKDSLIITNFDEKK